MTTAAAKRKPTVNDLTNKLLDLIGEGRIDNRLEDIMEECNARRLQVREQTVRKNLRSLNVVGTQVRISHNIRPKYLVGVTGKVVERPTTFKAKYGLIYVDLGRVIRGRYGPIVGVPAASLEKL